DPSIAAWAGTSWRARRGSGCWRSIPTTRRWRAPCASWPRRRSAATPSRSAVTRRAEREHRKSRRVKGRRRRDRRRDGEEKGRRRKRRRRRRRPSDRRERRHSMHVVLGLIMVIGALVGARRLDGTTFGSFGHAGTILLVVLGPIGAA